MDRERIIACGAGNFFLKHIEDFQHRFKVECVVDRDVKKIM